MALTDGLVSYYNFSSGSGSTLVDRQGSNNGTINGMTWSTNTPTYGTSGDGSPYSGSFDGTDDYVDLGALTITSGVLSSSAWVYLDGSTGVRQEIVSSDEHMSTTDKHFIFAVDDGNGNYISWINDNDSWVSVSGGTTKYNQWVHVAFTYDGETLTYYENGVSIATTQHTGSMNPTSGTKTTIGSKSSLDIFWLNGNLDDVAIWDRALSSSEVSELYNYGIDIANYQIKGQVTLSGTGVSGAIVTLVNIDTNSYVSKTTTDSSGNYTFTSLPDNTTNYHVSVSYDDGSTKYNDDSKPWVNPIEGV